MIYANHLSFCKLKGIWKNNFVTSIIFSQNKVICANLYNINCVSSNECFASKICCIMAYIESLFIFLLYQIDVIWFFLLV